MDRAAAEDIVQETFVKIWERRTQFTTWLGLRSYIYTIVRRDSANWLRGDRSTREKNDLLASDPTIQSSKLEDIIRAEVFRHLQDTVQTLPNQCRQVVTLIFMEGKSTKQVAQQLDVSQATVKVQKSRGLKLLRLRLPGKLFSSSVS